MIVLWKAFIHHKWYAVTYSCSQAIKRWHALLFTFWATVCKSVHPMLSDCCLFRLPCVSVIHPASYLDSTTACTIATSIVHSKLDYCNSLYYNLSKSQITRLQLIQNSLARAVVKSPKSCHITPVLRSLHWLKINERIQYKLLSLTYKVLTTNQPPYLHHLISVQPPRSTRSSSLVTLSRPQASSSLRITDRSFRYASPWLWSQLPSSLRQPHFSPSVSVLAVHAPITSSHSVNSPLSLSLPPQDLPLHKSFPSKTSFQSHDWLHGLHTGSFLLSISVFCF